MNLTTAFPPAKSSVGLQRPAETPLTPQTSLWPRTVSSSGLPGPRDTEPRVAQLPGQPRPSRDWCPRQDRWVPRPVPAGFCSWSGSTSPATGTPPHAPGPGARPPLPGGPAGGGQPDVHCQLPTEGAHCSPDGNTAPSGPRSLARQSRSRRPEAKVCRSVSGDGDGWSLLTHRPELGCGEAASFLGPVAPGGAVSPQRDVETPAPAAVSLSSDGAETGSRGRR